MRKPVVLTTKLEKLLAKALLSELCKGGGDITSINRWAKRVTKQIMKIKVREL